MDGKLYWLVWMDTAIDGNYEIPSIYSPFELVNVLLTELPLEENNVKYAGKKQVINGYLHQQLVRVIRGSNVRFVIIYENRRIFMALYYRHDHLTDDQIRNLNIDKEYLDNIS